MALLTDSAEYYVPPNDKPDGDHRFTLFTVADDIVRLRERIIRLKDPNCHAEYPPSHTRRLITNVRITGIEGDLILVSCQFRDLPPPPQRSRRRASSSAAIATSSSAPTPGLKIQERRAILDAEELGAMGAVSFLL